MRGKWTFLPLLLCLALLAGCTGTPGAAGTDAPAPAATETAGPVLPTAEPAPALSDREPPLTDYEQARPAPEFLDEEQQDLYRRAGSVYTHLFGGMTNEVEYSDTFPLGTYPNGPAETFEDGEYTYVYSRGRYRNWADFEALVSGVFTEAFFDGKNDAGGGYPIFREKDGRLCFLDLGRGTGDCRNFHFPDTFELLYQSEDEISFYVVGSYSLMYPREGESTAERDARAAELGYPSTDDDGNITITAMLNWGTFYVEDGVITEIYLSDGWRSWGNLVW